VFIFREYESSSELWNDAAMTESWTEDWQTGQTKYIRCLGSGENQISVDWRGATMVETSVVCP
jgi:hypothetical protein